MRLIGLYEWIAGSQHEFTRQFQNNDQLFNQAQSFWNQLNGTTWSALIVMFVIGIATAIYYYTAYNNKPGRHFTLPQWAIFIIAVFLVTFMTSLAILYFFAKPKLNGAWEIELLLSLGNSIYAVIVYTIMSIIWCNCSYLPTNAYRVFKF